MSVQPPCVGFGTAAAVAVVAAAAATASATQRPSAARRIDDVRILVLERAIRRMIAPICSLKAFEQKYFARDHQRSTIMRVIKWVTKIAHARAGRRERRFTVDRRRRRFGHLLATLSGGGGDGDDAGGDCRSASNQRARAIKNLFARHSHFECKTRARDRDCERKVARARDCCLIIWC